MTTWEMTVGDPKVRAYERPDRAGVVYLSWYEHGQPKARSLGFGIRGRTGKPDPAQVKRAVAEAEQQVRRLQTGETEFGQLTLGQTQARIIDVKTGKYPAKSQHRKEVLNALQCAAEVWGKDRAWATIRRADFRALWRSRIQELRLDGHAGVRGAEVTVARVLAIARWLKEEELIPVECAVVAERWKAELRGDWKALSGAPHDYEPKRPRYTVEEFRRILAVADLVDPRFALLTALAAEQRLGGAARHLRRSHVHPGASGVTIPTNGKKRGVEVILTAGQRQALFVALVGYLAPLEAAYQARMITDYPLFPGGRLIGWRSNRPLGEQVAPIEAATRDPISRSPIGAWWEEAETLAGVPHAKGRLGYGGRRAGVDGAVDAGADPATLEKYGGWTDSQVPQSIYRDHQHRGAAVKARDIRARVRGEVPA